MKAHILVTLKKGVLDPQGRAVKSSLESLGFQGVGEVRVGKYIEVEITGKGREEAEKEARTMAEKLLSHPVVEEFSIEVRDE